MGDMRIGGASRVPGQNGFNNQNSFKAEWQTRTVTTGREVVLIATATKPLIPSPGPVATITVFQEVGGRKVAVGAPINAKFDKGQVQAKWSIGKQGEYHFEVRIGSHYGRTDAQSGALKVAAQGFQRNHGQDIFIPAKR